MIEEIIEFIGEQGLFRQDEKILLAVSGGMDSMVMLDLFHRAGFRFGIAHCNFSLRGKESDEDAKFVKSAGKKYQIPCFLKKFKTEQYAKESGLSIQMAARKLRYEWFEEIRSENSYDYIATAHHLDDQIETFFINLIRGTGIAGLHGIHPKNGKLIRPMLFTFRNEIEKFAQENTIRFREDKSNQSLKYTRNLIRHRLIPVLKTIQLEFATSITETIAKIRGFEIIGQEAINLTRESLLKQEQNQVRIEIEQLKKLRPLKTYAFELFSSYGFNPSLVADILENLDSTSSKIFFSPTHKLIKDRKNLIISEIGESRSAISDNMKEFLIEKGARRIESPLKLKLSVKKIDPDFVIPRSPEVACLDIARLKFPLSLRRWQAGDSFYPLGLNKKKKLSDFFIDKKLTLTEKENTWLLISGDKIGWVIGQRIDNRFRVTSRTKEIFIVMLIT